MSDEGPKGGPLIPFILVGACCGAPILIASGALSGFGAWLSGGGLWWLLLAFALVVAGLLVRRRGKGNGPSAR